MELTREQVIEILEKHHMWTGEPQELVDVRLENAALEYAISSLKTDEAYQLMYEGREVFTKADLVAILKDLKLEIEKQFNNRPFSYNHHQRTEFYRDVENIIQQKIDALKENTDGSN